MIPSYLDPEHRKYRLPFLKGMKLKSDLAKESDFFDPHGPSPLR